MAHPLSARAVCAGAAGDEYRSRTPKASAAGADCVGDGCAIASPEARRAGAPRPGEADIFRIFVIAVLGFILGAVVTYLGVVFGVTLAWDMLGVHDQDGGGAMTLGLVIGPFFGFIGGVVGAFLLPAWIARRNRDAPPQTEDGKARDRRRFVVLGGAILGGIVGYYAAQIGFRFVRPIQIDSYWKVWAISWVPTIVTLLGAVVGGLVARGRLRSI